MRCRLLSMLTILLFAFVAFTACGRGEQRYDGYAAAEATEPDEPTPEQTPVLTPAPIPAPEQKIDFVDYMTINRGGEEPSAKPHPFALELQNIINNLPAGHTFGSATLINLGRQGEHQGIWVLTYGYSEDSHMPYGAIIYLYNSQVRRRDRGFVKPWFMNLTSYNMMQRADGHGFDIIGLHNGNLVTINGVPNLQ